MDLIEKNNESLKGVLPKNYGRDDLDKQLLGQVVDVVSNIKVGGTEAHATDVLGQVYEYFLEQFAIAEGRRGGEFYTPRSVVRLLVEMIEPYKGRVFDPCCGSAGMFIQSMRFIAAHSTGNGNGGKAKGDLSIYGQESNQTTLRLAKMNLAIRGIEAQIEFGDSFRNDRHPDLKADYILANPPFNISEWSGDQLREDKRWVHGIPPAGNANYAWVQHFLHHLAPRGIAGFVLANGSMSSTQSGEGEIRKNIVEADLVDCIIALPGQLFRSTQIPACLWFLSRVRSRRENWGRERETLFIDMRQMGYMLDRTRRDFSDEDIAKVAGTYHAWRDGSAGEYEDDPGFCKKRHFGGNPAPWGTSSRQAGTSELRHRLTTANPSHKKWPGFPPNGGSSNPKAGGWTRPLRKTWRYWGLEVTFDRHPIFICYQIRGRWQP